MWIGIDLDGVLAHYDRAEVWDGSIGPPVELMVSRVREWIGQGHDVRIVTARADQSEPTRTAQIAAIRAWSRKHLGQALLVQSNKDKNMVVLFDDRAVAVEVNTGRVLGGDPRILEHFLPEGDPDRGI